MGHAKGKGIGGLLQRDINWCLQGGEINFSHFMTGNSSTSKSKTPIGLKGSYFLGCLYFNKIALRSFRRHFLVVEDLHLKEGKEGCHHLK